MPGYEGGAQSSREAKPPGGAESKVSSTEPGQALPELPSLFEPVIALREGGDAMARAIQLAPLQGAGTLVWVRSHSRIEVAVVLEPEWPLAASRPAIFAAMGALADALGAYGPPDVPLTFRWPATVIVNEGAIGRARLAWPQHAPDHAVPDWLVVGVEARLDFPRGWEPGHGTGQTSLREEGWTEEDVSPAELTAAWARHLMAALAEWQRQGPGSGFPRLAERFLARLPVAPWMGPGRRGLDPATGDIIMDHEGARRRHVLVEALGA